MNEDGRALVERARAGDADALERLVAELRGPVRAFFDRNVGADSELGFARGLNALWVNGGLQYAPPIR